MTIDALVGEALEYVAYMTACAIDSEVRATERERCRVREARAVPGRRRSMTLCAVRRESATDMVRVGNRLVIA